MQSIIDTASSILNTIMSTGENGEGAINKLVKAAVKFLLEYPSIKVPMAMRAVKFTAEESEDRAKQMRVRRALEKEKGKQPDGSNVAVAIGVGTPGTSDSVVNVANSVAATSTVIAQKIEAKSRKKSLEAQKDRVLKKRKKDKVDEAYIYATELYSQERKKANGMSARDVAELTEKKFGVGPCSRTITRLVNEQGLVSQPAPKVGAPGKLPSWAFTTLCTAFESFISINQLNALGFLNSYDTLSTLVNNSMQIASSNSKHPNRWLLRRVLESTGIEFLVSKEKKMEERRIKWTTQKNLNMWFDNWAKDLVGLGFATWSGDVGGEIVIPPDQLRRILNFDETCLTLDGESCSRGGRPRVLFYNPHLPQLGSGTVKASNSATMITGSNAAGEAIPPHFQFMTAAKSDETTKFNQNTLSFFTEVRAKFGLEEETMRDISVGLNEKGGMNEAEFEKYVMKSIVTLYPDARDVAGKRVMIKLDSGPGRMNTRLLAKLKHRGFYLYPGVPNTTHVTQETDRNYGPFKTQFVTNLKNVVENRIVKGLGGIKCVTLPMWMVGLIVFGGTDPDTGFKVEECAYSRGFSTEACLNAWAKVGAAPLTRQCLKDKQVRRELGDGDKEFDECIIAIQVANDIATHALTEGGFCGEFLAAKIEPSKVQRRPLTQPLSKERIEAISHCATHGELFHVTNGNHLMTSDFFKAQEMKKRRVQIADQERVKKDRLKRMKVEEAARAVLIENADAIQASRFDELTVPKLTILLHWYGISGNKTGMKKDDKLSKWRTISKDNSVHPPACEQWTADDEAQLQHLKNDEIRMEETEVGRYRQEVTDNFTREARDNMTDEQWSEYKEKIDADRAVDRTGAVQSSS